jgi:hypothetical protein
MRFFTEKYHYRIKFLPIHIKISNSYCSTYILWSRILNIRSNFGLRTSNKIGTDSGLWSKLINHVDVHYYTWVVQRWKMSDKTDLLLSGGLNKNKECANLYSSNFFDHHIMIVKYSDRSLLRIIVLFALIFVIILMLF